MISRPLLAVSLAATAALACIHDFVTNPRAHSRPKLAKRSDDGAFPPTLTPAESLLVNSFDNTSLSDWAYYYTHGDHLGGRNRSMAEWTAARWAESGLDAELAEYWIYTTYPRESSLVLNRGDGTRHEVDLIEDVLGVDETTSYPNSIPAFHAMSGSGQVVAEYVYVGRGTQPDFDRLVELGAELEGKIAVAMYGEGYRGLKVKNAQDYGMAGCIIFTDPIDDGEVTVANGYAAYPDGPARQPSSIQRGSVRFSSIYSGDPTSVGYASERDGPRNDVSPYTPSIPSIPISMADAIPILEALNGQGFSMEEVNRTGWMGGLDVDYSSGPAPGTTLNLTHFMSSQIQPVWDTIGIINGTSPDEVLVVGNHRDAWVIGGAADPNSGSAILVELSRAFGRLLSQGWRPRRTIILASWDAEEFGLQGSTEWVESHLPWLNSVAVAYLNIDIGVSGPRPSLSGTGELQTVALENMRKILFPEGYEGLGPTLYDAWYNTTEGYIPPLGSGSDYASFFQNGISALDIASSSGPTDPVYHYHSNYDSYHWMATFADPGFHLHTAMGQFLTLLTYHIADDELLPFDTPAYATVLGGYLDELRSTMADAGVENGAEGVDTAPIEEAIGAFGQRAEALAAAGQMAVGFGDANMLGVVNSKLRDFQRGFASQGGLPSRGTFHNLLSAPGLDNGYSAVVFPPITEGVESGDLEQAREWVGRTASAILRAADIMAI